MVLAATQSACKRRKSYKNQTNAPTEVDLRARDERERERREAHTESGNKRYNCKWWEFFSNISFPLLDINLFVYKIRSSYSKGAEEKKTAQKQRKKFIHQNTYEY